MPGRVLLDTNIVIAVFAAEADVQNRLASGVEVFVPSIVIGELYYGAYKSGRATENLQRVAAFASRGGVLACDAATAGEYGRVKDELRRKGRPIPENDIWIAAVAFQHQLTLVSRDDHFRDIDELDVEKW